MFTRSTYSAPLLPYFTTFPGTLAKPPKTIPAPETERSKLDSSFPVIGSYPTLASHQPFTLETTGTISAAKETAARPSFCCFLASSSYTLLAISGFV
ncbi:hypothetical protein P4620_27240 [Priestia megaterium]|nr:hypothetical protein [Priestia megaterium]MED4063131.1 hypothetical protein [Priestia megaterium]